MTKKTNLFKGLLATASTLAVVMGSIHSGYADSITAGAYDTSIGTNLTTGGVVNTPFVSGTKLTLTADHDGIVSATTTFSIFDTASHKTNLGIGAAGVVPVVATFTSIADTGGGGIFNLSFPQNNNDAAIFAANFDNIGTIDFKNHSNPKVLVNHSNLVHIGTIDNGGNIEVGAGFTLTQSGNVGATAALNSAMIDAGSTLKLQGGTNKITTVTFANNTGTLVIDSTKNAVATNIANDITGGTVTFMGGSAITNSGPGRFGIQTAPLLAVNLTSTGAGNTFNNSEINTNAMTIGGSPKIFNVPVRVFAGQNFTANSPMAPITWNANSDVTFNDIVSANLAVGGKTANITITKDGAAIGTVTGGAATTFTTSANTTFGLVGSANGGAGGIADTILKLNINGAGGSGKTVKLSDDAFITETSFADANNNVLLMSKNGNQAYTGKITTINAGNGMVQSTVTAGNTHTIVGRIGQTNSIANVKLSGAGTLELTDKVYTNAITLDGTGTIKADNLLTTDGVTTNNVSFTNTATAATTLDLASTNTKLGAVTVTTDKTGKVVLRGDTLVSGQIGAANLMVNEINLAVDKTLTVSTNSNNFVNFTTATDQTGTITFLGGVQTGRVGSKGATNPDGTVSPVLTYKLVNVEVGNTNLTVNRSQEFVNGVHAQKVKIMDTGAIGAGIVKFDRATTIGTLDLNGTNVQIVVGPDYVTSTNVQVKGNSIFDNSLIVDSVVPLPGRSGKLTLSNGVFKGQIGNIDGTQGIAIVEAGANSTFTTMNNKVNAQNINFIGTGGIYLKNGTSGLVDMKAFAGAALAVDGKVFGDIRMGENTQTLTLDDGSSVGGSIITVAAGNGIVNSTGMTKTGAISTVGSLHIFSGTATVSGDHKAQTTVFEGDAVLDLTGANTLPGTVTAVTNNTGKIMVHNDFTINNTIGTTTAMVKEFNLATDNTTAVNGNNFVNFTTATDRTGTLTFSGGKHTGNIGTKDRQFKTVMIGKANQILQGNIYAVALDFGNNNVEVTIPDGMTLNAQTVSTGGVAGTLKFAGNATINKDVIPSVSQVVFAGNGNTINVNANLQTQNNITTGMNTLLFNKDAYISSNALNLTNATLALNGNSILIQSNNVTLGDTVIQPASADGKSGMIYTTNTVQDLSNITFDLNNVRLSDVTTGQVIMHSDVAFTNNKFTVVDSTSGNNLRKVSLKVVGQEVVYGDVTRKQTIQDFVRADIKNNSVSNLANQLDSQVDKVTGQAKNLIDSIDNAKDSATAAKILAEHAPTSTQANVSSDMVASVAGSLANDVHQISQAETASRMASLNTGNVGKAAGTYENPMGAWAKGFYQNATEKARGDASGYKADIGGGTVGMDVGVNDNYIIGAAISYADTNAKFKGFKSGNKLEAQSMQFNVYSMYDFCNDMFMQSTVNFGHTKVKAKNRRTTTTSLETAVGKYDVVNYGASVLGGMNYVAAENMFLTPMLGVSYSKFLTSGYNETGSSTNQIHNKKNFDKVVGTVGLRLSSVMDMGNDMKVTPEVHAFVNQDLKSKGVKDSFTIDGLGKNIEMKGKAQPRTSYNLGLGVTAKSGNMEYGASYDANLRTKYMSHQGALKIRVNF